MVAVPVAVPDCVRAVGPAVVPVLGATASLVDVPVACGGAVGPGRPTIPGRHVNTVILAGPEPARIQMDG